jgi:hypothetical protein
MLCVGKILLKSVRGAGLPMHRYQKFSSADAEIAFLVPTIVRAAKYSQVIDKYIAKYAYKTNICQVFSSTLQYSPVFSSN